VEIAKMKVKAGNKRKVGNRNHPGNVKRLNNTNGQQQQQQLPNISENHQFFNPGFINFGGFDESPMNHRQQQRFQPNQKPNNNRNNGKNQVQRRGNVGKSNNNRNNINKRPQQFGPGRGGGFPMMNRPMPVPDLPPPMFRGPMPSMNMNLPPRPFPPHMNGKFGRKPLPLPMRRGPPPPFMGPMGPPMGVDFPMPRPGPWQHGPPIQNVGPVGPIRRNKAQTRTTTANAKNKTKKTGTNPSKKALQSQNQYSLDKPWVTDELKAIHAKKQEYMDKLKGVKNDQLFEEFRKENLLFKTKYDAAKLEYVKKHSEKVI
jgi:DNA binding protein (fs(1)K10, female sterile(1)K10)